MDALILGGGFYGCHIALALKELGFGRVQIIEREPGIMRRASYVNQARVHNGYHYPRSLTTGISSRRNFNRFVEEHPFAVVPDVEMIYGIACNSRVTGSQFARFCDEIGAACREDRQVMNELFDPALIETCFSVTEIAFDASALARNMMSRLVAAGVDCRFGVKGRVSRWDDQSVIVDTADTPVRAQYVFNCTYAYLDDVGIRVRNRIKKELTEIALIKPPREMSGRAVTVMDGPFFSSMPFPSRSCYSLTHVRYTPHMSWTEAGEAALRFDGSRAEMMIRDTSRYMPSMRTSAYLGSLYELKTILVKSENSDSRPIVFERSDDSDRMYSVLGSKIDNIYDVLAYLKQQPWLLR
ncbi:FAD-dependent oxidoreductase [Microvirga sp.]|uniref:FAD-dependent oxidoreductase n=1 Tax=Microvirga sp. TaxID=1873136 RepID=UPI001AEEA82B|nr:FAD-dependent oxidoreductase [Microvirga sp.]